MFYGRYDYPTGKFLWGKLRYQRVSEYNLQTFLNMKNSKLREEQIMSAKRDYYEVLGVSRDADKNTIKKAYRKLAKKYHPDTNQGNAQAAERFKEATEAYNILSDPEKKKMYDQFGHAAFDGSGAAGGAYGGAYSRNGGGTYQYAGPDGTFHEYHFEGNGDMDDFLKNIFGGSFGGFGGATRSSSKGSRSGFSGSGFGRSGFGGTGFSGSGFGGSGFSGSGFGESGSYANYSQGGADVTAALDFLKVPNKTKKAAQDMLTLLNMPFPKTKPEIKEMLYLTSPVSVENYFDYKAAYGENCENARNMLSEIIENAEPYKISDLKIRGEDLKKLGIRGRETGEMLEALRKYVIPDPTLNTKSRLLEEIKNLRSNF